MTDHTEDFAQEVQEVTKPTAEERVAELEAKIASMPKMSTVEQEIYKRSIGLIREFWYGFFAWPDGEADFVDEIDLRLQAERNRSLVDIAYSYLVPTLATTRKSTTIESYVYEGEQRTRGSLENKIQEAIDKNTQTLYDALHAIEAFQDSPEWAAMRELFSDADQWLNEGKEDPLFLIDYLYVLPIALPFIRKKLDGSKKPHTLAEFDKGDGTGWSDLDRAIDAALFEPITEEPEKAETAKKVKAALPKLEAISKKPKRYIMPNNNIVNSLHGRLDRKTGELIPIINAGAFDLPVMKSGKPGEVTAYTMVTLDENSTVSMTGKKFTEFDRCVFNSVCSLWESGNTIITPEMVSRTMTNKTDTEYVSTGQQSAVTKSIEKLRHIFVKSDLSEEIKKRKATDEEGNPVTEFMIDGYMLQLKGIEVTAGGKKRKAFLLDGEPPLLTYSKLNRQLVTIDLRLLDIRRVDANGTICETLPTTESRQPIKEYLGRRIKVMKNDRRNKKPMQDHHILYETFYRETGIDSANKTEAKRARDYACQVLDYWKAMGEIKGYSIEKDGKKLHSILIEL